MRVSKSKIIEWSDSLDEISIILGDIKDNIDSAENECSEINSLQSDIYHSYNNDDYELEPSEIQSACDDIDRKAQDTIDYIGQAQHYYREPMEVEKKVSKLYNELADMLEPNIFQKVFNRIKNRFNIIKSYRLSIKCVRK